MWVRSAKPYKFMRGLGGSVRGSPWLGLAHTHLSSTAPGNLAVRTATRQPKHLPRHLLASVSRLPGISLTGIDMSRPCLLGTFQAGPCRSSTLGYRGRNAASSQHNVDSSAGLLLSLQSCALRKCRKKPLLGSAAVISGMALARLPAGLALRSRRKPGLVASPTGNFAGHDCSSGRESLPYVHTRSRTWVVAATTRRPSH